MRRRMAWVLGLLALQGVALVVTAFVPGFGSATWHHGASLAGVLILAVAVRRHLWSRPFLGIGVLVTSLLATVSGFWLLYWKEGIRVDGLQDWGVWWHVAWSWAAAVFIWQHIWVNRVTLGHYVGQSLLRAGPAVLHVGLYVLVIIGFALTAGPWKSWFDDENYIPISVWTWIVCVVAVYAAWALWRGTGRRNTRRSAVDLALVPMGIVAVASGLPLLLLGDSLDAAGLKYASKYWHVGPSVLFAVLVYTHSVQLWTGLRGHWRHLDM